MTAIIRLFGILFFAILFWTGSLQAEPPAAVAPKAAKPKEALKEPKAAKGPAFMRVRREAEGKKKPLALETAVVSFVSKDETKPGVVVDLIGAVHVGEKSYYDELNKLFESYDVVLYELVAPEGTRVPKGGRKEGTDLHPVGAMQNGLSSMLELSHQLNCVDYTKANFVHADMSPEEFSKTMADRNESWTQMFFALMGQGMAQQAGKSGDDTNMDMLLAFMSKNRAQRLKMAFAKQFENMEGQMESFNGKDGSTIITERNRKAFEVLTRELAAGKKKIGVFYGAGHLADMQKRLETDFGMKRTEERWLMAWDMTAKPPEGAK